MGLGVDENILRRAAGYESFQNEAVAGVPGAGGELAVGKRTGAALTELDVGGLIQPAAGPEPLHIRPALLHGTAALEQNGAQSGLGQHQSGKEAAGPCTHHYRRDLRRGNRIGQCVGFGTFHPGDFPAAAPAQYGRLVLDDGLHGVDQLHAVPGVHAAPQHPQRDEFLHPQQPGGFRGQLRHTGAGRQLDIFNLEQSGRFLS